jgi:hypothetical protein
MVAPTPFLLTGLRLSCRNGGAFTFAALIPRLMPSTWCPATGDADPLRQRVERRREDQTEAGDAQHAGEHGGA